MSAFRQVVRKLQDGQREEAMIGLEFVLRLDPTFRPALNLQRQLSSGAAEIDLSTIIDDLQAPTTDAIEGLLVEAVEDFDRRNFIGAKEKVEKVLLELPGHAEARQLLGQINQALKVETQVGQFLSQAREALDQGDPQEAANFVMMAQALDPHHAGIEATLQEIYAASGASGPSPPLSHGAPVLEDRSFDHGPRDGGFAVSFDEPVAPAASPPGFAGNSASVAPGFSTGPAGFELGPDASPGHESVAAEDWGGFSSSEVSFGDEPVGGGARQPAFGGAESDLFRDAAGDVSDLFEAGAEPTFSDAAAAATSLETELPEVAEAVRRGDEAFEAQRFAEAIHAWSRGLLADPENEDLSQRIAGARIAVADLRRRFEETLDDARSAAESGDRGRALELVDEVLALEAGHVAASLLREQIALPTAAAVGPSVAPGRQPSTAPSLPSLEEDLFSEDLGLGGPSGDLDDQIVPGLELPTQRTAGGTGGRRPPWLVAAVGGAALVVVALGVWVGFSLLGAGGRNVDVDPVAVNQVLDESQALFDERRVEEAIHLLQSFPASGLQRERLDRRIASYQVALAPPTPTPIPEGLIRGRELLEQGQFLTAYTVVHAGLEASPQDPGLIELRERITSIEPLARSLHAALSSGNFRAAVGAADGYLSRHPSAADGAAALDRSLFNAALAELRAYNLTGSEVHLRRLLQRRPDDAEARRVLEFIERYKASPVDIQFQTFSRSLSDR